MPMSIARLAGVIAATGPTAGVALKDAFNVTLWGGTATVQLERSFDDGATWIPASRDSAGTLAQWSVTPAAPVSVVGDEPERGVLYRLNCTAFTAATNYRVSQ